METAEVLGVLAHRGGVLVRRPELSVGVVRAITRPSGLEVELLARRPLDRRTALERQRDIRSQTLPAPRRLLPDYDEGVELRLGWLDHDGRAHWEFPLMSSSTSGDHYEGAFGPSWRTVFLLPPVFDEVSLVLAWPEIGFPETIVTMPLPDRATVERDTTTIWDAPLDVDSADGFAQRREAEHYDVSLSIEEGEIVAAPRVLNRQGRTAVVLNRLTAIGEALSIETIAIAHGQFAAMSEAAFVPRGGVSHSVSVAVVRGQEAISLRSHGGECSGGDEIFAARDEFAIDRPDEPYLDLVVGWPLAGLDDVRVRIPLERTAR